MADLKRGLLEYARYPDHPPRKASSLYTRTHKLLIREQDTPCAVCGVRYSTLKDSTKNHDGAIQLETHHWLVEYAGMTEIDWDKLAAEHPDLPNLVALAKAYHVHIAANGTFTGQLDPAIVTRFVDSTENMLVLCDVHHRSMNRGIHMVTFPVWELMRYERGDWDFLPANGQLNDGQGLPLPRGGTAR